MRPQSRPPDWQSRFAELAREANDPRLKNFYQASCVHAQTPVKQIRFLALDLETTGLNTGSDRIVELAMEQLILPEAAHLLSQARRPD